MRKIGCPAMLLMSLTGAVNSIQMGIAGAPHDALFFALGYLGGRDLLSVRMVCKSLS